MVDKMMTKIGYFFRMLRFPFMYSQHKCQELVDIIYQIMIY
ncbi:hypothetical protein BN193_04025 [Lactococcus raffinolactis 4877]|nr:hypothetical protein BN193_04025 [Lactococcus raffinolactis 4877]